MSAAYHGLRIEPNANVLGGQMCAWGDILANYADALKGCMEEYDLILGRVGALSQRTWRLEQVSSPSDWETAYEKHTQALRKLLRAGKI